MVLPSLKRRRPAPTPPHRALHTQPTPTQSPSSPSTAASAAAEVTGSHSWTLERIVAIVLAAQLVLLGLVIPHNVENTDNNNSNDNNNSILSVPVRIFPVRPTAWQATTDTRTSTCGPPEVDWIQQQNTPISRTGARDKSVLVYHAIPNTHEDIVQSVALRIAPPHLCTVRIHPTRAVARQLQYDHPKDNHNWYMAFVRDPTDRAVLDFFRYQVSQHKWEPTDAAFRSFLTDSPGRYRNRYLQELSQKEPSDPTDDDTDTTASIIRSILQDYDFIGVSERLDESLVVLQLLLGLPLSKIVYAADPGPFRFFVDYCVYQTDPFLSPVMREYFASSPEWRQQTAGDRLLHQAANASLDATIQTLGQQRVQQQLQLYRKAMRMVQTECATETVFPCSDDGMLRKDHGCLLLHAGCGTPCLDRIAPTIDQLEK